MVGPPGHLDILLRTLSNTHSFFFLCSYFIFLSSCFFSTSDQMETLDQGMANFILEAQKGLWAMWPL